MNFWDVLKTTLFGQDDIKFTDTPEEAAKKLKKEFTSSPENDQKKIEAEKKARLSWAKTKLYSALSYLLPDFKDLSPKDQNKLVTAIAKRPDVFAQILAANVADWDKTPKEVKRKIMSTIYSPEQMEALDKWPWFDPVFALSPPIGFGVKNIVQAGIKAGVKAALQEAGKTAIESGASLLTDVGTAVVGEPLEEKHPVLANILAPLTGVGIGVAAEKGIPALAKKLGKKSAQVVVKETEEAPKIKEVIKDVGEKAAEETAEESLQEVSSPSSSAKSQARIAKVTKAGLTPKFENIAEEVTSTELKANPEIKDKPEKAPEEVPIPSRGEPGLHEAAGELNGPQETSSHSTINNLTQETPTVKAEGNGWIIVPSEKGKFRVAFENSDLGELVKDALSNQLEQVKEGEPPRLYRIETAQGPIEYTRSRSTFPSWFKNKGWTKERVVSALEKALKGEPLTEKQAEIVKEALNSKEVKDYISTILAWGGEEVKLHAGIPVPEMLEKGFKTLGEVAAEKGHYKIADVLGYGKEIEPKDIKGLKTFIAKLYNLEDLVRRFGKEYPEVKEIEYAMKWIREKKANRWAYGVEESIFKPFNNLSKESKQKVLQVLYKESLTGKPAKVELTPEERNVYRRIRRFLTYIWNDIKESYKEALLKYVEAKPMSNEERAILKRALAEANPELIPPELKTKHATFYRHLVRYSEMHPVPFYMPQKRTGEWIVKIINPDTKETLFAMDFKTRSEALKVKKALEKGDKNLIHNWFKNLGEPVPPELNQTLFYHVKVEKIPKLPVEVGEEIPFSKTVAYLHSAAERVKGVSKDDLSQFYMAVAEDLDNFLKSLGWSSHLIKRKNIPGFSMEVEEAEKRLRGYLYGYGLSRAKKEAMEHSYKAFYKLVNKKGYKPAGLIQELHNYLNYAFGTPESKVVQKVNRVVALWYLGGRLKSALINATQNFTSGITAYIRHKIPTKQLLVGLKKVFRKEAQTLADRKALARAIKEGWLDANIIDEMMSQWRSVGGIVDTTMLPFRFVETYVNRATHFMGAFDYLYRVKKLPFEEAYHKAVEIMLEGHFWASRFNRAAFERGNWGRLLTALQTFTFHYFRYAFDLANKKEWKALAWLLGSPMILGGIAAIPGGDLIKEHVLKPLYEKTTGKDLEVDLSKHPGLKYGIAGYLSPSISMSVGVGFSEDPTKVLGGALQNLWNQIRKATKLWERGDKVGAIAELLPLGLRDIYKAVKGHQGLTTAFGEIIVDEHGRPVKLTGKEAFMMALGFRPKRIQKLSDLRNLERDIQEKRSDILRRFGTQFMLAKNTEEKKAVWRALREYNQKVLEKMEEARKKGDLVYYRYWRMMYITPREVYRWAQLTQRPEKGIRREIKSFARMIYQ